jgi:hypothetical protein
MKRLIVLAVLVPAVAIPVFGPASAAHAVNAPPPPLPTVIIIGQPS